jgi:MerR family transcriptional regulator, light-induced transcriptional regulator
MSYRIKSVAAITGLSASTLRAWERRYQLVQPSRSRGGYRVYSDDDVGRIMRIKSLVDNGFMVSEAIALTEREAPPLPPASVSEAALAGIRGELLDALIRMDRAAAGRICERLASLPYERRVEEVFLPVLNETGLLWECGAANVAQEHFVSAFMREKLMSILDQLDSGPPDGEEAVCAGIPGEQHEIGLLAAAVHLALHGYRVTYLGPDLPFEDLGAALAGRSPAIVCTSIISSCSAARCDEIASALRAVAPESAAVVLGGRGLPHGYGAPALPGLVVAHTLGAMFGAAPTVHVAPRAARA